MNDLADQIEAMTSIASRMNGFLYRCRNDKDYSMIFMTGNVPGLTGHQAAAFTGPARRSYAAMTHPADLDKVYAAVDAALARHDNWSVDYRIQRPCGTACWVHEVGGGVWDGVNLLYLEGIVIDVETTKQSDLRNAGLLGSISGKARTLVSHTVPIVEVLRTLRILAINARLEAGRAGPSGAGFAFVAREVSRLAEETSVLAEQIADVTRQLQDLLKAG